MDSRIESDSLGEISIETTSLWGAGTERARLIFGEKQPPMPTEIIEAVVRIKRAAARVNSELGLLSAESAKTIVAACDEILAGQLPGQFPLTWLQSGSGTNTNMNINEVIANRASEIAGGKRGDKSPVHPNDHVNSGQSSNDVMPTALHLACLSGLTDMLLPALDDMGVTLQKKSEEFALIIKTGRTHLMDAAPISLGQTFGGWATRIARARADLEQAAEGLRQLPLGGTAVGTGLNAPPGFAAKVAELLSGETGRKLSEASDHFEAQGASDRLVRFSGALRATAVAVSGIADNLRLLGSGPTAGLSELQLPTLMPGSSIMPGKVNPVACEVAVMAAARVIGNDSAVTLGGLAATFELNTMMPLLAVSLIESLNILSHACRVLNDHCLKDLKANEPRIALVVDRNPMLVTALVPEIGYDKAAEIAKIAMAQNRTILEVAREQTDLGDRLPALLDPASMISIEK
jgi:fumarate hydratase, class II